MPQIKEYQSSAQAVGATGGGRARFGMLDPIVEGFGALGRSVADIGKDIQEREDRQREANLRAEAMKADAELGAALEQRYSETDPQDREAVGNFTTGFMETVEERLGKVEDNVRTPREREVFTLLRGQVSAQALERARVKQAQLGGKGDRLVVEQALSSATNALMTDPTKYDYVVGQTRALIASQPNLSIAEQNEIEAEAVQALTVGEIQGIIRAGPGGPAVALKLLKSGDRDGALKPQTKATLIANAEAAIRAEREDAEHRRALAERARRDKQDALETLLVERMVPGTQANKDSPLTGPEIASADLRAEQKITLLNQMRAMTEHAAKPFRTQTDTYIDLQKRMFLPPEHPERLRDKMPIYQAFWDHRLTPSDQQDLLKQFDEAATPDGSSLGQKAQNARDLVRTAILQSPYFIAQPALAADAVYRFNYDLQSNIKAYRDAGKDPNDLLDPTKPEFMLKPEKMAAYTRGAAAQMRQDASAAQASVRAMPAKQTDLVKGEVYQTSRGPARWNGKAFETP